ncbi:hypothetical protein [Mycolicibacterium sp. 050158]|uniref:hypothetical protein n=1 Tax=Mycolicibacterium sp. 050158 TaxID=3090602 RepID=UPI00299D9AFF|nr:hypothetical protein [Mycolicibacterium sp. 050158]MDX1890201.1 hypothetical protein [Mycolicibacterium sp. 050158]
MFAAAWPSTLGRRACAALAVGSAVLHGLMVGSVENVGVATLVIVMAVACLYCARELWMAGSLRAWCVVAVMNLGMVAVHWSMPGHHHGQVVDVTSVVRAGPMPTLMLVATSLSIVEAAIAAAVLWVQTRSRASSLALASTSRGAI